MNAARKTLRVLEDFTVNVRIRLAALWVALLLIYIYVDIFSSYKPGTIQDILLGKVWGFEISQASVLPGLALMMIPSLMVFLSMILKAGVSRLVNIIVAVRTVYRCRHRQLYRRNLGIFHGWACRRNHSPLEHHLDGCQVA
jgi:hypothetical protein